MVSVVKKQNTNQIGFSLTGHGAGLGILAQIYSHSHPESKTNYTNIVLKSGLTSLTTTNPISTTYYSSILSSSSSTSGSSPSVISSGINDNHGDYYRLKSCQLCCKPFRPDQDIYMYRGDQGFCSEKCRNRQIMTDERKEKEAAVKLARKKMAEASPLSSTTDCSGCETCRLLADLRQRRLRRTNNNYKPTHQPILSIS